MALDGSTYAWYVLLKACLVASETHQYPAFKMFCALLTIYEYTSVCVLIGVTKLINCDGAHSTLPQKVVEAYVIKPSKSGEAWDSTYSATPEF